jgi:hypothetical protein
MKFNYISAGRKLKPTVHEHVQWNDPELPYVAAGMGYGGKHRHHYQNLSRSNPAKVPLAVQQRHLYEAQLTQLFEDEQRWNPFV